MKKIHVFLLGLIIVLAFFLRFYRVSEVPPSLNWDEVSIGYNAYSILKTGQDEWGASFPINFKSYGEYKLPVQIYASIPAIAIFGLNDFAVRITPVVYGTLTVLLVFFLAQVLFQNVGIGLLSAGLLAISPWHIQLTRGSFESSFATFWIALGMWFFVKGFKSSKWWIWSIIPFAISVYTYNTTRVLVPLFLLAMVIVFRETIAKFKKTVAVAMVLFVVLMLPLVPYYLSGEGNSRYRLVSITDDPGLLPRINQNRGLSSLPIPLPRLIHNKVTYVSFYVMQNYLTHFTPDFLFISGAPHKQHSVQGMGELYWFQAPFLLFGLYLLLRKRLPFWQVLIAWLLLTFVPVAVTNDSIPNALRPLIAVPIYQMLTALGLYQSYLWLKKKHFSLRLGVLFLIIGLASFQFVSYLNNYYNIYPVKYSFAWQYGYKQAFYSVQNKYKDYPQIFITKKYGEPHEFLLFYSQYNPTKYCNDPTLVRYQKSNWYWVDQFDKYRFVNDWEVKEKLKDQRNVLLVTSPGNYPPSAKVLETINFLDGTHAFDIVQL